MVAPPPEHDGQVNPENPAERVVNSWNIVPMGHIVSHIASHTTSFIKTGGYQVHQLMTATHQRLPFLVMDTWSVYAYIKWTIKEVMLNQTRVPLGKLDVRVYPLKTSDWLGGCRPLEHHVTGKVEFTLTVSYVMFPKDFRQRSDIYPGLSPLFPSQSLEVMRELEGRGKAQVTRLLPSQYKRSNADDDGQRQEMDQEN